MAKSNIKEARKAEAAKRRKKRNILIGCGVVAACAIVAAVVLLTQPKTVSIVRNANADLLVQKADIGGGLNHIDYGGPQQLLFWRDGEGVIQTAYDTCEECYASGNARYSLSGGELICSYCQTRLPAATLGSHSWGGCQPVAIPVDFRADTADEIVIPAEVLELAEVVFARWDTGTYDISLGDHAHSHDDH